MHFWFFPESEFMRIVEKGINRIEEFDYNKALQWLNVRADNTANTIRYECKECGKVWSARKLSSAKDHYGLLMLGMLCPKNCNTPEGYEETSDNVKAAWIDENERKHERYIKEAFKDYISNSDNSRYEKEDWIEENQDELLDDWNRDHESELEEYIENWLADWLEERYAERFCEVSNLFVFKMVF
jgi:hypothetical protein